MKMFSFLLAGGLAALTAALALPPVAAQAQDGRDRDQHAQVQHPDGRTLHPNARGVAERVDRAQRATQIENRADQRAARIERSGDRAARDAAQRGNYRQAERIDRESERDARRVEQQANRRAEQVMQGREWRQRDRDDDRRDWGPRDWDRNRPDRTNDRDQNWNDRDRGQRWRGNDRQRYDNGDRDYRQAQQRWNRGWRNDNRYDWNRYRESNRRLYSPGRYHAPYSNYGYRRLNIGLSLDSLFFSSRYRIDDPWQYRLPAAQGPYRWVRYYDDVLLVDTYSGEVVDVIYEFFW